MNATTPVFQAQRSNDATPLNAPASARSQASSGNSRDFAGALNDADSKQPARKASASKPHRAQWSARYQRLAAGHPCADAGDGRGGR